MNYTIKWLPEAEVTYALVLEYLEENWTSNEITKFIDRTGEVISYLTGNPRQYLYSKKKDAYRAVVTNQVSLYYRIKRTEIELLIFWDTRQDPSQPENLAHRPTPPLNVASAERYRKASLEDLKKQVDEYHPLG